MGNVFYGQIMNYMDKCNKYSYRIKLFSKFLGIDQNLFTLDQIRGHVFFGWSCDGVICIFNQICDGLKTFSPDLRRDHDSFDQIWDEVMTFFRSDLWKGHDFFVQNCEGVMTFLSRFETGSWLFWQDLWRGHDFFDQICDWVMIFWQDIILSSGHGVLYWPILLATVRNWKKNIEYFFP